VIIKIKKIILLFLVTRSPCLKSQKNMVKKKLFFIFFHLLFFSFFLETFRVQRLENPPKKETNSWFVKLKKKKRNYKFL
jgi:hypothetical protein